MSLSSLIGVSEKQLAANRANAARSTGPRSADGKKIASSNALKHGLTADRLVLPGESADEYRAFAEEIIAQLSPRNLIEREMCERIISAKTRRSHGCSNKQTLNTCRRRGKTSSGSVNCRFCSARCWHYRKKSVSC